MALSSSFVRFIEGWTNKANAIALLPHDLASYFDKFFTLFVIYNRLYAEATYTLWRDARIEPPDQNAFFPDSAAAKHYVAEFLDGPSLVHSLESNRETRAAIREMERILDDNHFFVLLRGPRAEGSRPHDEILLRKMRSHRPWEKAKAVLEFIHAIRCNTFHGSKEFDRVQIEVLAPCITVISHLNELLRHKLEENSVSD